VPLLQSQPDIFQRTFVPGIPVHFVCFLPSCFLPSCFLPSCFLSLLVFSLLSSKCLNRAPISVQLPHDCDRQKCRHRRGYKISRICSTSPQNHLLLYVVSGANNPRMSWPGGCWECRWTTKCYRRRVQASSNTLPIPARRLAIQRPCLSRQDLPVSP
jgi:hypothetical protein